MLRDRQVGQVVHVQNRPESLGMSSVTDRKVRRSFHFFAPCSLFFTVIASSAVDYSPRNAYATAVLQCLFQEYRLGSCID